MTGKLGTQSIKHVAQFYGSDERLVGFVNDTLKTHWVDVTAGEATAAFNTTKL